jgi:hypothetical protein
MDDSPNQRKTIFQHQALQRTQHDQGFFPIARLAMKDGRWTTRFFEQTAFGRQRAGRSTILFKLGALIRRGCRTGASSGQESLLLQRHDLQREHPANERLGIWTMFGVNTATSVRQQENARSIFALS